MRTKEQLQARLEILRGSRALIANLRCYTVGVWARTETGMRVFPCDKDAKQFSVLGAMLRHAGLGPMWEKRTYAWAGIEHGIPHSDVIDGIDAAIRATEQELAA
jgi:hypothetical protein